MRKIVLLLFLLFFTGISQLFSAADRAAWWQKRIENIAQEKEALSQKDSYPLIQPVLAEDIERTKELISCIRDETNGNTRRASPLPAEQVFESAAGGAFAAEYSQYMIRQLSHPALIETAKKHLASAVAAQVREHFPDAEDPEIDKIAAGLVTPQVSKSFAHELLLQSLLADQEKQHNSFVQRTQSALQAKYTTATTRTATIEETALQYARDRSAEWEDAFETDKSAVDSSAVWRDLQHSLDTQCRQIQRVSGFLTETELEDDIETSLYYLSYPSRLENKLFSSNNPDGSSKTSHIRRSIAHARSAAFQKTGSVESSGEVDTILNSFNTTASKAAQKYRLNTREEAIVQKDITLSHRYIALAAALQEEDADSIYRNITYRMERLAQYSDKLEKTYMRLYLLSGKTLDSLKPGIDYITKRMTAELKYLGYNATIIPKYREILDEEQLTASLEQKKTTHVRISNNAAAMKSEFRRYRAESDARGKAETRNRQEASSAIGTTELSVLHDTIMSYHDAWKNLTYSRSFFRQYRETFDSCYSTMKDGQLPDDIEEVLSEKSLLGLLPENALARLQAERKAKKYLAAAIKRDIVRFNKLREYYRSAGVTTIAVPSTKELYAAQEAVTSSAPVRISSWTMNEENVTETDRKAAALLTTLYRKNRWEGRHISSGEQTLSPQTIKINDTQITIAIPDGWKKTKSSDANVRVFTSEYDDSSFSIILSHGNTEKDAVHKWLSDNRLTKVQLGWDRHNTRLYYWNIAKDENNTVSKIYAFSENGNTILLCGSTDKSRYPFFHNKIDTVFKSIEQ